MNRPVDRADSVLALDPFPEIGPQTLQLDLPPDASIDFLTPRDIPLGSGAAGSVEPSAWSADNVGTAAGDSSLLAENLPAAARGGSSALPPAEAYRTDIAEFWRPELNSHSYTVSKGDTVSAVVSRDGYAWRDVKAQVRQLNPGVDLNNIRPGQELILPGYKREPVNVATIDQQLDGSLTAPFPEMIDELAGDPLDSVSEPAPIFTAGRHSGVSADTTASAARWAAMAPAVVEAPPAAAPTEVVASSEEEAGAVSLTLGGGVRWHPYFALIRDGNGKNPTVEVRDDFHSPTAITANATLDFGGDFQLKGTGQIGLNAYDGGDAQVRIAEVTARWPNAFGNSRELELSIGQDWGPGALASETQPGVINALPNQMHDRTAVIPGADGITYRDRTMWPDGIGRRALAQFAADIGGLPGFILAGSVGPNHVDGALKWSHPFTGGKVGLARLDPEGREVSYEATTSAWIGNKQKGPYITPAGGIRNEVPAEGESYWSGFGGAQVGWHIPVEFYGTDARLTPFLQIHRYENRLGDDNFAWKAEAGANLFIGDLPGGSRLNLAPKLQLLGSEGEIHYTPVLSLFLDGKAPSVTVE